MTDGVRDGVAVLRDRLRQADVAISPFPHFIVDPALGAALYDQLEQQFPSNELLYQGRPPGNNRQHLMNAIDVFQSPEIAPVWRAFIKELASPGFFSDALGAIAPYSNSVVPDIERRLGKPLAECTMSLRGEAAKTDLKFDVQIGINSPVLEKSSVRQTHVDRPNKVFNALLYMRVPGDDTEGGDLGVYEWLAERRYRDDGVSADDADVRMVETIAYGRNKLLLFQNSPVSLHGVTPREPTPIVRRYVNLLLSANVGLFETSKAKRGGVGRLWNRLVGRD